ncbi:glucose 1-dehydrogenase [Chryseobacterium sp. BIGb0232]|uniref:glucose 1-dehydrogenase n=1 Tax=Chryseobacterium sp. BIGb0232 TaxID=2940598 RepID=UPI000F4ADBB5|nr:glucose 1-dehydrogenase [Chryseobacterium sp. BIGb0232]MCS4302441.1 NAD(P)-dependent dehydrogenase (short-subunit alcohol dehydrogenase family) [Chryseobacterium sp. BIGb0232]ROS18383.1 NAD(P)-dependent dehydrogenase (short-subunit alcohol dehydrogenase family) [Chryseobacterium nakagawai]
MEKLMIGKAGLVTGAASGIGRASAILFAKEGASVMVSDLNEEGGKETVKIITDMGGNAAFFKCDVSNESDVQSLIAETVSRFGKLDFAHNNAGIPSEFTPLADTVSENWIKTININLNGVYYALKYEIQAMLKTGGGCIVNTSSVLGAVAHQNKSDYASSKAAVNHLTKCAALEYASKGIRINVVSPGPTKTPLAQEFLARNPEEINNFIAMIPTGQLSEVEDVANATVWLCSENSNQITGVILPVDGGQSAGKF